jgi:hypothetical protein
MRPLLLLICLFFYACSYAQSGVYLSADDYLNNKLTDECKSLSIPSRKGPNDRILLLTSKGSKTYTFYEVWGFKDGIAEYRVVHGRPMLIVCKGVLWAFSPNGSLKKKGDKIVFQRTLTYGFGEITVTKDIRDPEPITYTGYPDLWKQFEPKSVPGLKEYYSKLMLKDEDNFVAPEEIINYYNSTRPGYVPPIYTDIE